MYIVQTQEHHLRGDAELCGHLPQACYVLRGISLGYSPKGQSEVHFIWGLHVKSVIRIPSQARNQNFWRGDFACALLTISFGSLSYLLINNNPPLTPKHSGLKQWFSFSFLATPSSMGILVPQSGIQSLPPAVEARSLNHWTAREIPAMIYYFTWF